MTTDGAFRVGPDGGRVAALSDMGVQWRRGAGGRHAAGEFAPHGGEEIGDTVPENLADG